MANLRSLAILLLGALQPAAAAPFTKRDGPLGYIVRLKSGISARDVESHLGWVREVHQKRDLSIGADIVGVQKTFHINDFNAYSGDFDEETLAQIKSNPDVLGVEENQIIVLPDGPGTPASEATEKRALVTQDDVVWGLGAISHSEPGSTQYIYDDSAGSGTWAYVIDSGVRTTHEEFGGRAVHGYNVLENTSDDDNMGHGTHVAGTIAGKTVGIAKKTNVISIKTFDATVTTVVSDVLDALSWAVNDIVEKGRQDKAVINMSIITGYSQSINDAVNSAFAGGIIQVVAAGNTNSDAGKESPSSAADALTVGAVNSDWRRWSYSSWGTVLDLFAPGSQIISASIENDTALVSDSGTSMATPHVAGVALYLQALEGGSAADISRRIIELAHPDVVEDTQGSPNRMLYNGNGA